MNPARPRVVRTVLQALAQRSGQLTAAEAAALVCQSTSRLRHQFAQDELLGEIFGADDHAVFARRPAGTKQGSEKEKGSKSAGHRLSGDGKQPSLPRFGKYCIETQLAVCVSELVWR